MTEIGSNVESSGRALYHRWCGSDNTDEARYYDLMNPADKDRWEALGRAAIHGRIAAVAERDALAARVAALEAQRDEALKALDAAIEVAVDMRPYVPDYFAKKWKHDEEIAAVIKARRILSREGGPAGD